MSQLKVGDTVIRMLAGTIPMEMKITSIHEGLIWCGPWCFDETHGYEIDPDLGWGEPGPDGKIVTGSYIKLGAE